MADNDEREKEPTKFGTLDALQVVFLIAGCSGIIFAINGRAHNEAQALFRLGIMGVGLVGLVVVTALKFARKRRP